MTAIPQIDGTVTIRSPAGRFLQAFRQRVATGLLTGRPHPRSRYTVTEAGPEHLTIGAADWWSAVNVGLNRVELRQVQPGVLRYHVRYWRWAQYALGVSGGLGLVGIVLLLSVDVRGYMARNPSAAISVLSIDQNVFVAWLMVLFWGFVWPWLLIALHKRPLRKLITRLITEVDAEAASTGEF
jgi:hypothetical protein